MIKRFVLILAGFVAIVVVLGAIKGSQIKEAMSMSHAAPPSSVTTYEAQSLEWRNYVHAIGSLAPVQGVTLSADAAGAVMKLNVENGAAVKKGDLLVEIDASVEQAQLAAAEARANLAKVGLERSKSLLGNNTVAQSEFDAADASYKQAVADKESIKAAIDKKFMRAPFDGRVGIRVVNVGEYVSPGTPLLPLQQLDPIYVNFNVPQRQLAALAVGQSVRVAIDGVGAEKYEGKINAINSVVDPVTRNVAVQAILSNPKETLRAGMFARVEVELPDVQSRVVVPATAISYASYGNSVFIVEKMKGPDGQEYLGVRQQFVTIGDARGDLISIEGGVKPGEQIVSAGVFKLRNGVPVQVNNTVQPSANLTPKPANT
jgi:membrane fusion protein (multidrug efflux system)